MPSRSDSNSNGHFPPANGNQPTGTPRGFSLQNYSMNSPFPFPMPPMFGNMMAAMGAAPGWGPPGGQDERGAGPIRRGGGAMGAGGRYNSRAGPYDRRGGAPGQRYDGGMGAGGMVGGRGGRGGPAGSSRWGDGAAGGAAMGPREAVQGRSLKSYEDLDQVSGGGSGELNY